MEPVRRILDGRRADTVARLLDAALEEVRAVDYGDLTVRSVAKRAEVSPATAYTYFSSKEHLISSVAWRKMQDLTASFADGASLQKLVRGITDVFAQEPELSRACTTALLADDPEVARLRDQMSAEVTRAFSGALSELSPTARASVEMAFVGGMVMAGQGYLTFDQIADRLAALVKQLRPATAARTRKR
ncbi:TetR/AcrR family transcriptional regulator [Lentzea sp. NPDC051213]|uniref:TetR/AcrR family transcriptional regulator n=1 Tax=Lentzea sp. NPDC051213 TaxID=3364126 RepID=UPI0037AB9A5F